MENPAKTEPPKPLAPDLRQYWLLKEDVAFLNHGSFGACPIPVLNEQQKWRANIEAQPIELLGRRCELWLMAARRVGFALPDERTGMADISPMFLIWASGYCTVNM